MRDVPLLKAFNKLSLPLLTTTLFITLVVMLAGTAYILTLPPSKELVESGEEFQTLTYVNATEEEKEKLELTEEDFSALSFELKLINIDRAKVLVVYNGTKLRVISSVAIVDLITKKLTGEEDGSPFYYIFLSYFLASQCFPAGIMTFVYNSQGIFYNEIAYTNDSPTFRRICGFLARKIRV